MKPNPYTPHEIRKYFHEIQKDIRRSPALSEYTPLLAAAVFSALTGFVLGLIVFTGALVFRFLKHRNLKASRTPYEYPLVKIGNSQKAGSPFSGMLNRSYFLYMPGWAYKITGIFFFIAALFPFSVSWIPWFISLPIMFWMFSWGRAYLQIGAKASELPRLETNHPQDYIDGVYENPKPQKTAPQPSNPLPRTPNKQPEKKIKQEDPAALETARYFRYIERNLLECAEELQEKSETVDEFLDLIFGQSEITKRKYLDQIKYANDYVQHNLEGARRVFRLCGKNAPSSSRRQVLETYVQDSRDVVAKVNAIVDELIKIDQSQTMASGDLLDERLEELAVTTSYYSRT